MLYDSGMRGFFLFILKEAVSYEENDRKNSGIGHGGSPLYYFSSFAGGCQSEKTKVKYQKDDIEKFADISNVNLYGGENVIQPEELELPPQAQGAVICSYGGRDYVISSCSYGRNNKSKIYVQLLERAQGINGLIMLSSYQNAAVFDYPNMTEDIELQSGRLYINLESASTVYNTGKEGNMPIDPNGQATESPAPTSLPQPTAVSTQQPAPITSAVPEQQPNLNTNIVPTQQQNDNSKKSKQIMISSTVMILLVMLFRVRAAASGFM